MLNYYFFDPIIGRNYFYTKDGTARGSCEKNYIIIFGKRNEVLWVALLCERSTATDMNESDEYQ